MNITLKKTRLGVASVLLAAIAGSAVMSCSPIKRGEYASGSATIFCDEGFQNILNEEIEVFEYTYPEATIVPYYVSEKEAIDTLLADATSAIIVTREFTPEEIKYMKAKYKRVIKQDLIAADAIALIVNKDNPVGALSMDDIKEILNGEITKWSQLAGDTTNIKIVFDNAGSSTVSYMREKFLPEGKMISDLPNAYAQKTNQDVIDLVKKDPSALGIMSVSWLGDDLSKAKNLPVEQRSAEYNKEEGNDRLDSELTTEVKVLKLSNPTKENDYDPESYKPYQLYIFQGNYPLVRKIYFVSAASGSTVMNSFFQFVRGPVGQRIIGKTGIIPKKYHQTVIEIPD